MKGDLYLNWFAFIGNVLCVKIHIYVFVVYGSRNNISYSIIPLTPTVQY